MAIIYVAVSARDSKSGCTRFCSAENVSRHFINTLLPSACSTREVTPCSPARARALVKSSAFAMIGLHHVLETRLSNVAQDELEQIADIIAALAPTDTPDVRLSPFADSRGKLHTSVLYKMLRSTQNTKNPLATFIWRNRAPPRVQFFAWLLVQERVQSREHLKRRHVLTDAVCEVCNNGEETAAHTAPLQPPSGTQSKLSSLTTWRQACSHSCSRRRSYPASTSTPSSCYAAGNCGSEETMSSSANNKTPLVQFCGLQRKRQDFGAIDCRRVISLLAHHGAFCLIP